MLAAFSAGYQWFLAEYQLMSRVIRCSKQDISRLLVVLSHSSAYLGMFLSIFQQVINGFLEVITSYQRFSARYQLFLVIISYQCFSAGYQCFSASYHLSLVVITSCLCHVSISCQVFKVLGRYQLFLLVISGSYHRL